MKDWKLPSQLVITDRKESESDYEFFHRHEMIRRLTAENDLIKCLDFIDSLRDGKNEIPPSTFIVRFYDKTKSN